MGFSLSYIKRNLWVYLSTFIIFVILSYTLLFSKYWSNSYVALSSLYSNFLSPQSMAIERNATEKKSAIDFLTVKEIDKILSKYDSVIKRVSYRVELAGIVQNGERESQFEGIGVDFKRDEEFLERYIKVVDGDATPLKSENSILISKALAEKIGAENNQSVGLYILNRDSEKMDYEIINSASLKISGIFEERFDNREIIILPIRLAKSILKSSDINMVIVDFYLNEDMMRYRDELQKELQKIGLRVKSIESRWEIENINFAITVFYMFIFLFMVILAYRDVSILIERRREDISTLINYGWGSSRILFLNIKETFIFHLIAYMLVVGTVFTFLKLTTDQMVSVQIIDCLMDIAPIVGGSLVVHTVFYIFFAKFTR